MSFLLIQQALPTGATSADPRPNCTLPEPWLSEPRHDDANHEVAVTTEAAPAAIVGETDHAPCRNAAATGVHPSPPRVRAKASASCHQVDRGLTTVVAPLVLRETIVLRTLAAAHRFRVIRTFDLAVLCFPERPFKAALTAAQRAMRGIKKDGLLTPYRTDRQQHVYGLTQKGARWLDDHGIDGTASVRRVSEMTNPEHLLWANFIAVCCEARGLRAYTESELLRTLNRNRQEGELVQGLLEVQVPVGQRTVARKLRPDAMAYESDGATWFEIDRSKRGAEREASLAALFRKPGAKMHDGQVLKRVVVLAKSDRILHRALDIARNQTEARGRRLRNRGDRCLREVEEGIFEVITLQLVPDGQGRESLNEVQVGHVIVQLLPLWLPKVRITADQVSNVAGWLPENYLPYRRPASMKPWEAPRSPLLGTMTGGS